MAAGAKPIKALNTVPKRRQRIFKMYLTPSGLCNVLILNVYICIINNMSCKHNRITVLCNCTLVYRLHCVACSVSVVMRGERNVDHVM